MAVCRDPANNRSISWVSSDLVNARLAYGSHGDSCADMCLSGLSMPEAVANLVTAQCLLRHPLSINGQCCLDLFAGSMIVTLSLLKCNIPCVRPWDIVFGNKFDVLQQWHVLLSLAKANRLRYVHGAFPCRSFTLCRLPQLRSRGQLLGRADLTTKQAGLVQNGNELLRFTIELCAALFTLGNWFSIEDPFRSWAWLLLWQCGVFSWPGVASVAVEFYNLGAPFVEETLVLHCVPNLHLLRNYMTPRPLGGTWCCAERCSSKASGYSGRSCPKHTHLRLPWNCPGWWHQPGFHRP
jgi:hypothetical protein